MKYTKLRAYLDECFANSEGLKVIPYRNDCINQLVLASGNKVTLSKDTIRRINSALSGTYRIKRFSNTKCLIEKVGD